MSHTSYIEVEATARIYEPFAPNNFISSHAQISTIQL